MEECVSDGIDLTGRGIFIDHLSGPVGERAVLEGQSKQKRRDFQHNIYHCIYLKRSLLTLKIWAKGELLYDLTGQGIFIDHLSGRVGERMVLGGRLKQKRKKDTYNKISAVDV